MMGAGSSSLYRIRQLLIIKAYNARRSETSIAEQFFENVKYNHVGEAVLLKESIAKVLQMESLSSLDVILQRCGLCNTSWNDFIMYDDFVAFLEDGTIPGSKVHTRQRHSNVLTKNHQMHKTVYKEVWDTLQFRHISSCRDMIPCMLEKRSSTNEPKTLKTNIWKKHETVIQERVVKYVTRCADGTLEELEEREKKQDEVIHIECKDTGQFAHHELSQYEKTEAFNKEIVSCRRGTEELVQLKSLEDEYEYFEGAMPEKEQTDDSASEVNHSFDD